MVPAASRPNDLVYTAFAKKKKKACGAAGIPTECNFGKSLISVPLKKEPSPSTAVKHQSLSMKQDTSSLVFHDGTKLTGGLPRVPRSRGPEAMMPGAPSAFLSSPCLAAVPWICSGHPGQTAPWSTLCWVGSLLVLLSVPKGYLKCYFKCLLFRTPANHIIFWH